MFNSKLVLLMISVFVTTSHSFSIQNSSISSSTSRTNISPNKGLFQSSSPEDSSERREISAEQFLEESSRSGYEKVKTMSIEERTKRAMLAEAAEDRVVSLSDELDLLLGEDGMPKRVEDREEVTILAQQIKASMDQYKRLVNGEDCEALDMFSAGSSSSSSSSSSSGSNDNGSDNTLDLQ
jgi:hypothetical protein